MGDRDAAAMLNDAPRWQRRAAEAFDSIGGQPSPTTVRVIGAFQTVFGLIVVAGAIVILVGA